MSTSTDFIPGTEDGLITFGGNFKTKITLSPTLYGLSASQATLYGTTYDSFVTAHTVANNPATRSPMNVQLKNDAKHELIAQSRLLAGIVQRFPGTTNAMRIDLMLNPRVVPAPIPIPAMSPTILIKSVAGRRVSLRLIDASQPTRRGKPAGVDGATILSFVGDAPPENLEDWFLQGSTGRMTIDVQFPTTVAAFAKVWFTAYYFNPRKESGVACAPTSTYLAAGSLPQAV